MQNLRVTIRSHISICDYCHSEMDRHFMYFGKRIKVDRVCPHCHKVKEYRSLYWLDRFFLRFGFFTNPFYLPNPDWIVFIFFFLLPFWYGMFFITNVFVNLMYMPVGIVINNVKIIQQNK